MVKMYTCPYCGEEFEDRESLKKHLDDEDAAYREDLEDDDEE